MILAINLSYPRKLLSNGIDNVLFEAKLKGYNISESVKVALSVGAVTIISENTAYAVGLKEEGKKAITLWKEYRDPTILFISEMLKYRKAFKLYLTYFYPGLKSQ